MIDDLAIRFEKERQHEYYLKHKERICARTRQYAKDNREKVNETQKIRYRKYVRAYKTLTEFERWLKEETKTNLKYNEVAEKLKEIRKKYEV